MLCTGYEKVNKVTGEIYQRWPCGKCLNCKINKKRQWQARFILETIAYGTPSWITLTYRPEDEPLSITKEHLDKWIAKVRYYNEQIHSNPIRYYCRAEYRPETGAPHYHVLLWNHRATIVPDRKNPARWYDPIIEIAWSDYGGTSTEDASFGRKNSLLNRMDYITNYISEFGPKLIYPEGMMEEKSFMSRMPALGTDAPTIELFAKSFLSSQGSRLIESYSGIPKVFNYQGKLWPIPKILKDKLSRHLEASGFFIDRVYDLYSNHLVANIEAGKPISLTKNYDEQKRQTQEEADHRQSEEKRKSSRKKKHKDDQAHIFAARKLYFKDFKKAPPDRDTFLAFKETTNYTPPEPED